MCWHACQSARIRGFRDYQAERVNENQLLSEQGTIFPQLVSKLLCHGAGFARNTCYCEAKSFVVGLDRVMENRPGDEFCGAQLETILLSPGTVS